MLERDRRKRERQKWAGYYAKRHYQEKLQQSIEASNPDNKAPSQQ